MNKKMFKRLAKTMFNIAGDLKKSVVFTDVVEGTYDAALDIQVDTEVSVTIKAIVSAYLRSEVSEGIRSTDYKMTILAADIATIATLPRINDKITIDDVRFTIIDIRKDMANATFVMQIRE